MFIGDARRILFIPIEHEWNEVVRDITASVETEGMEVDMSEVEKRIKATYKKRARWALLTDVIRAS